MSSIDRQGPNTSSGVGDDENRDELFRDIHPLAPPPPPLPTSVRRREAWETGSHRSPSLSTGSDVASSENFTSMSREFSALVIAGSAIGTGSMEIEHGTSSNGVTGSNNNLTRIGEEDVAAVTEEEEETNPLAIVPDSHPLREGSSSPRRGRGLANDYNQLSGGGVGGDRVAMPATSVQRVKKEEVEAKISAWQNAKVAKINNRFKREDAIIVGWEGEQIHKASSWMKKVERKLEEKRARAMEKMQNDVAKARRKAEEKRASAEAKRGTKVARVLEVANLMRAVGRAPAKRSFF